VGCIKPLCDLLAVSDVRIVTVALEGLENILKVGERARARMCVCVNMCECAFMCMLLCP
jgi:hypothetical protein